MVRNGNPWLLVYTMGKVGTNTINGSIRKYLNSYNSFHFHWLRPENLRKDEYFHRFFYETGRELRGGKEILPDYIIKGYYLSENLDNYLSERSKVKIITMTRDPLARNISSFFENLPLFFGYSVRDNLREKSSETVVAELGELFKEDFIGKNGINFLDCDPLTWFDTELSKVFELNVYKSAFPWDKGYTLLTNQNTELLIMRLEDLNHCYSEAMSEFFDNGEAIHLESANVAEDKDYADVYSLFKEKIQLPAGYIDGLYQSKYATHFYSQNELQRFREQWTG
jgi:hypothetical protein